MSILNSIGVCSLQSMCHHGTNQYIYRLVTGDLYDGGFVVTYDTKMGVRWFPESRITTGLQNNLNDLIINTTVPAGVTNISIYGVGGGAGGTGSNVHGGGGGGAFYISNIGVTTGTIINITVGKGGKGGVDAGSNSIETHTYFGNFPEDHGGEPGGDTRVIVGSQLDFIAGGGTEGNTTIGNTNDINIVGQGGVVTINANPFSYSNIIGIGGRGGSRTLTATNGTDGGAGGGGGNTGYVSTINIGGAGSGRFGGGGGSGNAPSTGLPLGGIGGSEAGRGGHGGECTPIPLFGGNGGSISGQTTISNGGGRAYIASDGNIIMGSPFIWGSSGGGGFPGGGGGSSYHSGGGIGSDGASGMVQIEWNI